MAFKTFVIGVIFGFLVMPTVLETAKAWLQKNQGQLSNIRLQSPFTVPTTAASGGPGAGAAGGPPAAGWYEY